MNDPRRPPLPLLMQHVRVRGATNLPRQQVVPTPKVNNQDVDRGYWHGFVPEAQRRVMDVNNDRPINILSVQQQLPESTDPQNAIWLNTNCPPWNCPPYRSISLEQSVSKCVPWYEVDTVLGNFTVPRDYFYVIKGISYEALNAAQNDVFEIGLLVNNSLVARWEDICIDATQPNPASMYGMAGHYRTMPLHFIADRASTLTVRARLRGAVSLLGVSPNWAGQPIISSNCQMKVVFNGWMANLRENWDGGPRPTDLGDLDNMTVMDDQAGGQA